jgi:DNA end-binding protein Ku
VDRSDLVKGYEYEKGQYVIVTPEEIESVRLESTKTIDIERFVDAGDIDRLYWNAPYFLKPDGKLALEAFTVIREAMERTQKVALGRVVMHQRERLVALEPRDEGILAYTLRSHDEVRQPEEFFGDIPEHKADPQMIAIAEKIIEQQSGPFDPSEFNDRYEDALRDLIEQKKKGKGNIAAVEEPKDTNVVDLMEALRRSLGQSGGSERRKPATRKPAAGAKSAKKSPAKKAAPKKKRA